MYACLPTPTVSYDKTMKKGWGGKRRGALRYKKKGLVVVVERGSRRLYIASTGRHENKKDAGEFAARTVKRGTTVFSDRGKAQITRMKHSALLFSPILHTPKTAHTKTAHTRKKKKKHCALCTDWHGFTLSHYT